MFLPYCGFLLLLASCSQSFSKPRGVDILDRRSNPISGITVIPLVSTRSRLTFGPDGQGPESSLSIDLGEPFLMDSGNDLSPPKLRSNATMIAPMIVVGKDVRVYKWLLLKKGYYPMIIEHKFHASGDSISVDGQGPPPFRLVSGGDEKRASVIAALVKNEPDFARIRSAYSTKDLDRVAFSSKGKDLILIQK